MNSLLLLSTCDYPKWHGGESTGYEAGVEVAAGAQGQVEALFNDVDKTATDVDIKGYLGVLLLESMQEAHKLRIGNP